MKKSVFNFFKGYFKGRPKGKKVLVFFFILSLGNGVLTYYLFGLPHPYPAIGFLSFFFLFNLIKNYSIAVLTKDYYDFENRDFLLSGVKYHLIILLFTLLNLILWIISVFFLLFKERDKSILFKVADSAFFVFFSFLDEIIDLSIPCFIHAGSASNLYLNAEKQIPHFNKYFNDYYKKNLVFMVAFLLGSISLVTFAYTYPQIWGVPSKFLVLGLFFFYFLYSFFYRTLSGLLYTIYLHQYNKLTDQGVKPKNLAEIIPSFK